MRSPLTSQSFVAAVVAAIALFAAHAYAQNAPASGADPELVKQIREQVIKELRESGALDRAVDAGVERYVERQRSAAAERERQELAEHTRAMRPVSKTRDHIRGNPDAPVTIVEYSDFECPFCKRFHPTMKQIVDDSKGNVRWVYRHFPLDEIHSKARKEAAASECAAELGGNDAFWKFADRFYELTPSNNNTDIETMLPRVAREVGLDSTKFASCVASGRHDRRVAEDRENAQSTGGNGTPWSLVVSRKGKVYALSGAQPYASVKQLVELAMREK